MFPDAPVFKSAQAAPAQGAATPRLPPRVPHLDMLRRIGCGAFGEVWIARTVTGTYRAVKIIYRQEAEQHSRWDREFNGLRNFEPISRSHAGLVNILHSGSDEEAGYFYYVMELADDENSGQQIDPDRYV